MSVSQRLEVRQSQSLVMTPQLQQAIKLLQLSNLELSDYVASEIEQNPLLRADERGPASEEGDWRERSAPDQAERSAESGADGETQDSAATASSDVLTGDGEAPLDAEATYDDLGPADGAPGPLADSATLSKARSSDSGEFGDVEQRLGQTESLRDRLIAQLHLEVTGDGDRLIGLTLVDARGHGRAAGCRGSGCRARAAHPAGVRTDRDLCKNASGMSGPATGGTGPSGPPDGASAGPPRDDRRR